MEIGIAAITDAPLDSRLLAYVSQHRREKAWRYHTNLARKRSLYTELLLRVMLKTYGEPAWRTLELDEDSTGKPFFPAKPDLQCSLAHARTRCLCALERGTGLGADIEYMADIPYTTLLEMVIHPHEQALWRAIPDNSSRKKYFFTLWTAKEAYGKFTAQGLAEDFTTIDTRAPDFRKHLIQWREGDYSCAVYAPAHHTVHRYFHGEKAIWRLLRSV